MPSNKDTQKVSNRRTLILVLAVFVLPAVVAVLMYASGWKPAVTGNHGELIQPPRLIEDRSLLSLDGKTVKFSELHGKWTLVYLNGASCAEECMKQLFLMRQIHIAQGKDQDRVQRVFILTDVKAVDALPEKLSDYAEMRVWKGENQVMEKLATDFGMDLKNTAEHRAIYMLDPQGNLMMRYGEKTEPAGMRKDLARLLKYSSEK
jgi:cytochrome oxidase Cu insertion factor (SCO1/SenC/PrrC family)